MSCRVCGQDNLDIMPCHFCFLLVSQKCCLSYTASVFSSPQGIFAALSFRRFLFLWKLCDRTSCLSSFFPHSFYRRWTSFLHKQLQHFVFDVRRHPHFHTFFFPFVKGSLPIYLFLFFLSHGGGAFFCASAMLLTSGCKAAKKQTHTLFSSSFALSLLF